MQNINFSSHAKKRCQQRGIRPAVVEFIFNNGDFINTHSEKKFYISKNKLRKIFYKDKNFILKNDKEILSTRIVVNGNTVITAMKAIKLIRKN